MSKLRRNRLTAAVHLTLLLALPGLAAAQDAKGDQSTLDTISVTGSRIKQTNAVTAQPVYIMDRASASRTCHSWSLSS